MSGPGADVSVTEVIAGRTYWLTLRWNDQGTWREPIYSGRILDYDRFRVTVEIDTMGGGVSVEKHPRNDLRIQEMPAEGEGEPS